MPFVSLSGVLNKLKTNATTNIIFLEDTGISKPFFSCPDVDVENRK